jgi:hypothetical protein
MTKVQRLMVVLSACNLVMLAFALAQLRPAAAQEIAPVISRPEPTSL